MSLFDHIGLVTTVVALVVVFLVYFKHSLSYWKRKGVPSVSSAIPYGSVRELVMGQTAMGELLQRFYNEAKSKKWRYVGYFFFTKPKYLVVDPQIIKHILQADFNVFTNRGFYHNEEADPLGANLFTLDYAKWKPLRQNFTQTFTSGQMKKMFQTLVNASASLEEVIKSHSNGEVLDARDAMARFTTDIIASCVFGLECNSLKNPETEFRHYGRKAFAIPWYALLEILFLSWAPQSVLKFLKYKTTNDDVEKFFMTTISDTVKYRETNNVYRKDFMHLLIQLKNRGKLVDDGKVIGEKEGDVELNFNQLAAQAFIFYLAGFETSSTTSSFALYELALNQELQDQVRNEVREALDNHDGKITYDSVMEMKLLQRVVEETLRKYPPVPILDRDCNIDYKIPGTDVVLEKGIHVEIPVLGIQRDPEYYPNPDKFDPDRFTEENKKTRPPFTYLPFGEGPRICIGLRFGILQSKVGLAAVLKNHRVVLNSRTRVPLVMHNTTFILTPKDGIWLDIKPVE